MVEAIMTLRVCVAWWGLEIAPEVRLTKSLQRLPLSARNVGVIFLLIIVLCRASFGSEVKSGVCYQVRLAEKPRWIASVVAREEFPPLIVVDPVQNKLLAYSKVGDSEILSAERIRAGAGFLPTSVGLTSEGDLLLELVDGTVVQIKESLGLTKVLLPPQVRRVSSLRVGSLYQWKLAGNYLVAYGALLDEKDNLWKGFFRVPIGGEPQIPEILTHLPESDFYLIGNNYIATIGSVAYYVVMSESPVIFRAAPGHVPEQLLSFPKEYGARPNFATKMIGPRSAAAHLAELENFAVPVGLYSQGGFLYLLTRRPSFGRTEWFLYKIDPFEDKIISKTKLPTSANHLAIASSRSKWFLIQKGPVREMQRQDIGTMIVIDGSDISKSFPDFCPWVAGSKRAAASFPARAYFFIIAAILVSSVVVLSLARQIWLSNKIKSRRLKRGGKG